MDAAATLAIYGEIKVYVIALLISLPRAYAFIAMSQLLAPTAVPRLARTVAILIIAFPIVPMHLVMVDVISTDLIVFAGFFFKEYAIGFVMGYMIAWLFWAVQASGAFIDNQRGAAIAASIDPMQGHETSPLGILFSQAFITYFFAVGGFLLVLGLLYESYALWPVTKMLPIYSEQFPALMLALLDKGMKLMFILAAPVIAIMFLAEFALAIVSRFAPQIQVFILAMPIKSAIAILILIFYFGTLLNLGQKESGHFRPYMNDLYDVLRKGELAGPPPPRPRVLPGAP